LTSDILQYGNLQRSQRYYKGLIKWDIERLDRFRTALNMLYNVSSKSGFNDRHFNVGNELDWNTLQKKRRAEILLAADIGARFDINGLGSR